jgi:hypothetical protein
MSGQSEDQEREGPTLVPELQGKEQKRNARRPKIDERSRRGIVKRSWRRRPKEGRYRLKEGHLRAGYEKRSPFSRRRHSCRRRARRKSAVPNRRFLSTKRRETRTMSSEEFIERVHEGQTHLRDLRMMEEMRFWERFLDGYYAERVGPGPDAPTRWDLLTDEPPADLPW